MKRFLVCSLIFFVFSSYKIQCVGLRGHDTTIQIDDFDQDFNNYIPDMSGFNERESSEEFKEIQKIEPPRESANNFDEAEKFGGALGIDEAKASEYEQNSLTTPENTDLGNNDNDILSIQSNTDSFSSPSFDNLDVHELPNI